MKSYRITSRLVLSLLLAIFVLPALGNADWRSVHKRIDKDLAKLSLGAHEIDYSYAGGRITVKGFVSSEKEKTLVEQTIRSVDGVEEVENNLLVKGRPGRQDSAIAAAIRSRLEQVNGLGQYRIEIEDTDGAITLGGSAQSERDRSRIEQIASTTAGVVSVTNGMVIQTPLSDERIVQNVRSALTAESDISLEGVSIAASDGIVTIRGAKQNHREIDHILSVALMADGVRDVKSEMTIGKKE